MGEAQAGFDVPENFEGLRIRFDDVASAEQGKTIIEGVFSTFVPCGSQYAIWFQFPGAVRYEIRDLDSNTVHETADTTLSISHDGNQVYDAYGKKPCNKVIAETYRIAVEDFFFMPPLKLPKPLRNFEVRAMYYNDVSNVIRVENRAISFQ